MKGILGLSRNYDMTETSPIDDIHGVPSHGEANGYHISPRKDAPIFSQDQSSPSRWPDPLARPTVLEGLWVHC